MGLVFASEDLAEIEDFISAGYTSMRLRASSGQRQEYRIFQNPLGPASLDVSDADFELDYQADPLGHLALIGVESGGIARVVTEGVDGAFGPGEVFLLAQPDRPFAAHCLPVRFGYTKLEPSALSRVAATAPGRTETPVRLTGHRPFSPAAGRHLLRTITFLREHVAAVPFGGDAPLITSTAPQLLAATVLNTFPSTALADPTIEDRHDAHPGTVRRAMAFIDDHPDRDLTVADIAAAAQVTVRALQYAFRRHRGVTPMEYLRQVRLHHAHLALQAADPAGGVTVTEIAARWGFLHPGRFARRYRGAYGRPPHQTLLRHPR
ncbi:helix-turn-helix transcriptional regulator [Amycolatopsis samaneae]|uniref:Helix-turn-helix transcriptional regulator n=1 Tax=Amycolatopsis samaneae TaxID=664691 RepID=A0ABW5G7H0_9PSEU